MPRSSARSSFPDVLPTRSIRRVRRATITAIAVASALLATPMTAGAEPLPVPYDLGHALAIGLVQPTVAPPGANNPTCRLTPEHPRPVVLVNGTSGNMRANWDTLSPLLRNQGYCVYTFNTGGAPGSPVQTIGPIQDSASALGRVVEDVVSATGAQQVDLVGHSQGGTIARYYTNKLGGAARVHELIGVAPGSHGVTASNLISLYRSLGLYPLYTVFVNAIGCASCEQQAQDSSFIADLNRGGDTVPGPHYTVIVSESDEFSTPYTDAFLDGPATTNIVVQDGCPANHVGHLQLVTDRRTSVLVLNALDPDHAVPVPCYPEAWLG
ncbi:alpha/beta fold hydrolase [Gordonia sp. CPCC 205515]|uniref:esterase/lipase family protein n=1 Tax=Gordonia sp. CPCC 205515 TaxID=3140791 RepID=UPI003AF407B3